MALTSKPLTEKQLEANRANAQKSTGPKTPGGKYNSSRNATTHGFLARSILLPGESPERFNALHASYISDYEPATRTEHDLVETMTVCRWRLLRNWTVESAAIAHEQRQQAGSTALEDLPTQTALALRSLGNPPRGQEALSRHEVRLDRAYHRAADRLRQLQQDRQKSENKEERKRSHQLIENKETPPKIEPIRTVNEPQTNPEQSLDEAA